MDLMIDLETFSVKRRDFLRSVTLLPIVATVPASAMTALPPVREPYVRPNEIVSSLIWHLWNDPRNPMTSGPYFVASVGAWDGVGYPIVLMTTGWRIEDRKYFGGFYDFEWSHLSRDVPKDFWHKHSNRKRYPNVHAYVREQRFGENPSVMRRTMAKNARRTKSI